MDLSSLASWAAIVGAVQQLPQTITAIKGLLTNKVGAEAAEKLAGDLSRLSEAFFYIGELKTLHDETQILHNSFSKVISLTNTGEEDMKVDYIRQNWRFAKPEFERFFATIESFRCIKPVLPEGDFSLLRTCITDLDTAVKAKDSDAIVDGADRLQQRVVAILTKADRALKQSIEDLYKGILGIERGVRSEG